MPGRNRPPVYTVKKALWFDLPFRGGPTSPFCKSMSEIGLRIAVVAISWALRIYVNKSPAPASRSGRIEKVMGNRRACDRSAPGQSRDVLASRGRRIAVRILHECSVDPIGFVLACRTRPGESVAGGNKTTLAGLAGDRSRSQRHNAGRPIGRPRRVVRTHQRREQFNRHGKSARQLSIYRQFRLISQEPGSTLARHGDSSPPGSVFMPN
jgi:hypothetical protein